MTQVTKTGTQRQKNWLKKNICKLKSKICSCPIKDIYMGTITTILMNGQKYFFKVNEDLTISRSNDCENWEVIDFKFWIGKEANSIGTFRDTGELTSVALNNDDNRLILVTNLGNYVADGGDVIGDTWKPC